MPTCDCCMKNRSIRPVCVDDNYETELCNSCIRDLRAAGEKVEVLDLDN